ncbi:MAG TPA: hypothetical protein PLG90_05335 [Ignavibacteria bacterium]|nr:hypothetical protein [Ignavibacteria bacterium]
MRYKLILFLILFTISDIYSQTINYDTKPVNSDVRQISNEEVVFEQLKSNLSDFIMYYKSDSVLITDLEIISEDNSVKNFLNEFFEKNIFIYKKGKDYSNRKLVLKIENIKMNYPEYVNSGIAGDKSFIRNFKSGFILDYYNLNISSPVFSGSYNINFADTVKIENSGNINSYKYSFLNGKLPEDSFLNKYLLPVGLILTSITTIILFFVIRSN